MSDPRNVFADEWRACLRAHYLYVVRTQDWVTEPTLRQVLHQTGLTDEELAQLRALALGHDDVPEDDPLLDDEARPDAAAEDWPDVETEDTDAPALDADGAFEEEDDDWPDDDSDDADESSPEATGQLPLF